MNVENLAAEASSDAMLTKRIFDELGVAASARQCWTPNGVYVLDAHPLRPYQSTGAREQGFH